MGRMGAQMEGWEKWDRLGEGGEGWAGMGRGGMGKYEEGWEG